MGVSVFWGEKDSTPFITTYWGFTSFPSLNGSQCLPASYEVSRVDGFLETAPDLLQDVFASGLLETYGPILTSQPELQPQT